MFGMAGITHTAGQSPTNNHNAEPDIFVLDEEIDLTRVMLNSIPPHGCEKRRDELLNELEELQARKERLLRGPAVKREPTRDVKQEDHPFARTVSNSVGSSQSRGMPDHNSNGKRPLFPPRLPGLKMEEEGAFREAPNKRVKMEKDETKIKFEPDVKVKNEIGGAMKVEDNDQKNVDVKAIVKSEDKGKAKAEPYDDSALSWTGGSQSQRSRFKIEDEDEFLYDTQNDMVDWDAEYAGSLFFAEEQEKERQLKADEKLARTLSMMDSDTEEVIDLTHDEEFAKKLQEEEEKLAQSQRAPVIDLTADEEFARKLQAEFEAELLPENPVMPAPSPSVVNTADGVNMHPPQTGIPGGQGGGPSTKREESEKPPVKSEPAPPVKSELAPDEKPKMPSWHSVKPEYPVQVKHEIGSSSRDPVVRMPGAYPASPWRPVPLTKYRGPAGLAKDNRDVKGEEVKVDEGVVPDVEDGVEEYAEAPLTEVDAQEQLKALLENVKHTEDVTPIEKRLPTPKSLTIQLLEHQKLGLEWMLKMENGTNRGGILADDMGLGKTIQSIATIVSNPPTNDKRKLTLVIAPVSLILQWKKEIEQKVRPFHLKVYDYYGSGRTRNAKVLERYDVIITSYALCAGEWPQDKKKKKQKFNGVVDKNQQQVEADARYEEEMAEEEPAERIRQRAGPLFQIKWHRVILDEAHTIKNKATRAAKACTHLDAKYRWCLTGTPFQNNIGELFSLISFLRIKPYCEWVEFRNKISRPFQKGRHKTAIKRVNALMKAICLRRAKTSELDGKPIIEIPARNVNIDHNDFTQPERDFYSHLEARTQLRFNAYLKAGTVMKNYSHVLVLLLRLRQACCHPSLVSQHFEKALPGEHGAAETEEKHMENVLNGISEEVKKRLLQEDLNAVECSICLDAMENGVIIPDCGHYYCRDCVTGYANNNPNPDAEDGAKTCPSCRGPLRLETLLPVATFTEKFQPQSSSQEETGSGLDPEIEEELEADKWITSTKIDRMMAILNETRKNHPGEKTIIFSQFTGMLDLVETPLRKNGYKYERYDGKMSAADRDAALGQLAKDDKTTVLLVSLKCGSLGLNLTCANRVILLDVWWNPAVENQAIDRVHRFGQKREVTVHRIMIKNTVEDRIFELQQKKQELADAALGEGTMGKNRGGLNLGDLIHLFGVEEEE
ncbi:hypothetical protein HK104_000270 [Borealophlyctis nickersoniae]|nr:hypothetical protein HK104_000270 [Borealophlyctis nickersoniae]